MISAAETTGCDAIHPGYGFLSENKYIAEICEKVGLTFIGPTTEAIEAMADKVMARKVMQRCRPAHHSRHRRGAPQRRRGPAGRRGDRLSAADEGGRRRRRARHARGQLGGRACRRPTTSPRARLRWPSTIPTFTLRRYLNRPRHIEVQVLADKYGNVIHLGTRDCSLQRRHQKIVEEAPAPGLPAKLTDAIGAAAVKGSKAIGYSTVGTFEFLVDPQGDFYFIEMNTRIQVEHGITEMVTGVDLVKWQIRVAAGEELTLKQKDIKFTGHAIECRINAEDVTRNFLPGGGLIELYVPPGGPGVRVDSHLYSGYTAPSNYDSLLAKIMTWGNDRNEAIERMRRALVETVIIGPPTTIPFHRQIMEDERFVSGEVNTSLVTDWLAEQAATQERRGDCRAGERRAMTRRGVRCKRPS